MVKHLSGISQFYLRRIMKIRILESISNEAEGAFSNGDVVDWKDKKEAQQLIDAGVAEKVTAKKKSKTETASKAEEVETATTE
tara:strand:+ start:31 stop:279 length:249 start_codon:yes stop_codon:yes gene_type:complete